jgi:hypothetical protein
MTGPPTEAASISLKLKDDAKQGMVCGIALRGWRSVPLSFCVPPIQHIEAISLPSGSTQPCSPGRARVWPLAYTPQHVLKIPPADALGSDSLNFVPPRPPLRHVTWKCVKFKIAHGGSNPALPPRGYWPKWATRGPKRAIRSLTWRPILV